jgi:hypothetical protein
VNVRRGNEVMLERDNADKLVSAVGAQSMYVLIAGAGHEDAEFVPPAITATVAASTSAAVLANGNARSGRMGVAGFTEDQRSISVAFRHQAQGPRETSHRGPNARTDETGPRRWWGPSGLLPASRPATATRSRGKHGSNTGPSADNSVHGPRQQALMACASRAA